MRSFGMNLRADFGTAKADDRVFRESFDRFYRRELSQVIGLAVVLSGSRTGAEDLAQEGFLAAYREWDRVSSLDDPGAWVRRVVANKAVSRFRRARSEVKALVRIGSPQFVVDQIPEESAYLWREVRRLPQRQAQAVALRYFDGRSISSIAEILECSENTVKTHLKRAKATLVSRIEEEENHD